MSEDALKEKKTTVVITPEDVKSALDFWKHFEIPLIPGMQDAFDKFVSNPTFENQENVKYWLCKSIIETDHEAFKDEMFKKIVEECGGALYKLQFDRDLEKALSSDPSTSSNQ